MPFPPELFPAIRQRPGLYFGFSPPLTALHFFIQGWEWSTGQRDALPADFCGWVAYRTGASRSHGWLGMLLSVSKDEEQAFQRFFDLLEEYGKRRGRIIARITGHGKRRTLLQLDPESCQPSHLTEEALPDPILITTFSDDPGFLATTANGEPFGIWGYWRSWEEIAEREGFAIEDVEILDQVEFERIRQTPPTRQDTL